MPAKDLASIVMLLRRPRAIDLDAVKYAVKWAFEGDHEVLPIQNRPAFVVKAPGMILGVMNSDQPYFKDVAEAANRLTDFPARQAVQEHTAWLSVDLLDGPPSIDLLKAYAVIGKLVGEMISDDVLGLLSHPPVRVVAYDESFLPLLRGGRGFEILKAGSVDKFVSARVGDGELAGAAKEARRRWPQFTEAFSHRRPGQNFAVKKRFTDGEQPEHMWIEVFSIEGSTIYGRLANEPKYNPKLKIHDNVSALDSEIEDWLYNDGPTTVGGFQIAVFKNRPKP
jgi:uncharacterized protein YegJ (DUF2314 family)